MPRINSTPSLSTSNSLPSDPIPSSSSSTPQLSTISTDYNIEHTIQQCTNTSENVCPEDLIAITTGQKQHWFDATSDECLEGVRNVSAVTDENLDLVMVCNIQ